MLRLQLCGMQLLLLLRHAMPIDEVLASALEDLTLESLELTDTDAQADESLLVGYGLSEVGASQVCSCLASCSCCCCC